MVNLSIEDDGPSLHVLLRKEDLDPERLADKTAIVVDVLFATTSIIAALDHGVTAVYPAMDADEAKALSLRSGLRDPVLSGEAMFEFIDGFAPPTPLALTHHLDGRDTLVYTTTNGTVALRASSGAQRVLAGALVNTGATINAIDPGNGRSVIIICAGTAGAFNMEDFYGAGCFVDRMTRRWRQFRLTDAALAARDYFRNSDPGPVLHGSMVGRLMRRWGLETEVDFAARIDHCDVAAALQNGCVRRFQQG